MTVVWGHGPLPCELLVVGQNPGATEAREGRPFCGPSGRDLRSYFAHAGLNLDACYVTNVSKVHNAKDAPPTSEQIGEWGPVLESEIEAARPRVIAAVGAYATRWLLGDAAEFAACQGLAHRPGEFDASVAYRARGAVVVPCLHPAAALRDDSGAKRQQCVRDYTALGEIVRAVREGRESEIAYRHDAYAGREEYHDVDGDALRTILAPARHHVDEPISIDTEGTPDNVWSVQVTTQPGNGYVLRTTQPDFAVGAAAIQEAIDRGVLVVTHDASTPTACLYDWVMCRAVGIELARARVGRTANTMMMLYLLSEVRGLKEAAWRWCGMRMADYLGLIAGLAKERQVAWLSEVVARASDWGKPELRALANNDGTFTVKRPQAIAKAAKRLLGDVAAGKCDKDGNEVNIAKRWAKADAPQRALVEAAMGKLPTASIADVPLADAVRYAARDSDATLRLYLRLLPELERLDLVRTAATSHAALPWFEAMQRCGLPVSRERLVGLRDYLDDAAAKLQACISTTWWGGQPFNPKSTKHVQALMAARGVKGVKLTKAGAVSTGKKAIEHLRFERASDGSTNGAYDPAIAAVIEWREKRHVQSMYAETALKMTGVRAGECANSPTHDIAPLRCVWNPLGTTSRRPAANRPNLLAFPKHEKPSGDNYGQLLRDCFVCPPGTVLVECDLSQIELRVFAHESADPVMCGVYVEGKEDLHQATAARIFGVPYGAVTKLQRTLAKAINFGIPYGVQEQGLGDQLRQRNIHYSEKQRRDLIDGWARIHARGAAYIAEVKRFACEHGYTRDWDGHYRYVPGVWAHDKKVVGEAYRQAVNHVIQAGAQSLIQRSIAWLGPQLVEWQAGGRFVHLAMEVHDSLVFWCEESMVGQVSELAVEALTKHGGLEMRVPLVADVKVATSWGQL